MKKIVLTLLVLLMLSGCAEKKQPDSIDDNYRVMYQIFVGSFSDSNGDGTGDLQGIINRLDYLNDGDINSKTSLGVQGLWLSPIFASPSYHKYDVSDYYHIDGRFGDMNDLKTLIDECHKRNMIVILDLVLNHTSTFNSWFLNFKYARQKEDVNNEYYDFYTCVRTDEKQPGISYTKLEGTDYYYESNFSFDMPELNYDNEFVKEKMLEVGKYYLDLGVDGFRFDAIKYVYLNNTAKSAAFFDWYVSELKKIKEDVYCVGECWSGTGEVLNYVKEMNCFDFESAQAEGNIAKAAKGGNINSYTNYVVNYQKRLANASDNAISTPFIANHDMDRAAGYLNVYNYYAYMGANLLLLQPGTPFIYYGEEIGMKGTRDSNTDANRRLAMLWGDGDTISDPVGTTYDPNKQPNGTVKQQERSDESILNHYRKVIGFRNRYKQIARGTYSILDLGMNHLGGFIIEYNDETTYLIHNNSDEQITLDLSNMAFKQIIEAVGVESADVKDNILTVGKYTSVLMK